MGLSREATKPQHKNGFANQLRNELLSRGKSKCHVDAHATAGPSVNNAYVKRFGPVADGAGQWIVEPKPGDATWGHWWNRLDENNANFSNDTLRYRFPYMTIDQIKAELNQ